MREPLLMAAIGTKGVGKSYQHVQLMFAYAKTDATRRGRKVVILDINNEYGVYNIPVIGLEHIALFSVHPNIEIRRVIPFFPDGRAMSPDEWINTMVYVLTHFRDGMVLIEDINKFIGDQIPDALVRAICTNRHVGLDILLSYQSIGRINTKIWGNMNMLRFHKNIESVERHSIKFPEKFELLTIAENMVNSEYNKGNTRFFVTVDLEAMKILGDFTDEIIYDAIDQYIYENTKILKPLLARRENGAKKYNDDTAFAEKRLQLYNMYKG